MYAQVEKSKENKKQSITNAVSQRKSIGRSTFQFVDNRPETITQRKLQEMAHSSPKIIQKVTSANSDHWDNPGHDREKELAYQYEPADLAQLARNQNVPSGHKLVVSMPRRGDRGNGFLSHYVLVVGFTQGEGDTTANDHIEFVTAYFSHGAATQGELNSVYVNRSGAWRPDEG